MKERLVNYDDLPVFGVWDGSPIRRTVDCEACKYLFAVLRDDRENLEICAWGMAWKVLREVEKQRKCLKIGKNPPERSIFGDIGRIYENK